MNHATKHILNQHATFGDGTYNYTNVPFTPVKRHMTTMVLRQHDPLVSILAMQPKHLCHAVRLRLPLLCCQTHLQRHLTLLQFCNLKQSKKHIAVCLCYKRQQQLTALTPRSSRSALNNVMHSALACYLNTALPTHTFHTWFAIQGDLGSRRKGFLVLKIKYYLMPKPPVLGHLAPQNAPVQTER